MAGWQIAGDIGERLRELRALKRWTQEQLAEELQRRRTQAVLWENGTAKPPKRLLEAMAMRYGWPVQIFAEGGDRPRDHVRPEPAAATPDPAHVRVGAGGATASVAEPRARYDATGEAGFLFGEPREAAERFRTYVRFAPFQVSRTMIGVDAELSQDFVRQYRLSQVELARAACRAAGQPIPDFVHQIENEIITGSFR